MQYKCNILAICALALISFSANGQNPQFNDPYSRLLLGQPLALENSMQSGMGGVGISYQDGNLYNTLNPASLASLTGTTFQVSANIQWNESQYQDRKNPYWNGNLNQVSLGFTWKNRHNLRQEEKETDWQFGSGFTLTPRTSVGYEIIGYSTTSNGYDVLSTYRGSGGTYDLRVQNGLAYKDFSFGVDLGFLFGRINQDRIAEIGSVTGDYIDQFSYRTAYRGVRIGFGAIYDFKFKTVDPKKNEVIDRGDRISVGLTFHPQQSFRTISDDLFTRYSPEFAVTDILRENLDLKQKGTLPAQVAAGISYVDNNHWIIGADFTMSDWSTYANEAITPTATGTFMKVNMGAEWTPKSTSYDNYWERVRYRLGWKYVQDPRKVNDTQITTWAATGGIGFPVSLPRQDISFVNFGLQYGKTGLKEGIETQFFKVTIGVTLTDKSWFYKQKFK